MLGMSRTVAGDKTVEFEYLRIEQRADGIYYVAHPKARCPGTDFKLMRASLYQGSSANQAPLAEHRDASTTAPGEPVRASQAGLDRQLPADAAVTILVSSYPLNEPTAPAEIAALTDWLESAGFRVFYAEVNLGSRGRWQRVLVGAYTDQEAARGDVERLRAAAPESDAHLVTAGFATGLVAAVAREPEVVAVHSGTQP